MVAGAVRGAQRWLRKRPSKALLHRLRNDAPYIPAGPRIPAAAPRAPTAQRGRRAARNGGKCQTPRGRAHLTGARGQRCCRRRALLVRRTGPQLTRQRLAAAAAACSGGQAVCGTAAAGLGWLPAPRRERKAGLGLTPHGAGSPAAPEPRHQAGPRWHWQGRRSSPLTAASSCSEHSREDSSPGSCTLQWLAIRTA